MIARGNPDAFSSRVESYRRRVEEKLDAVINSTPDVPLSLREAMAYSVLGGGKRIRPLLSFAAAELCGVESAAIDTIAASLELVHAYSLVHDDLPAMDNDDLRRGKPTTHRKFNEATAILAGDALQALAFEILCRDEQLAQQPAAQARIVAALAHAIGPAGMVGGQILDIEAEGRELDEAALEAIHRSKTGQLIWAAIMMPSELASLAPEARNSLNAFARDIGLVFQIRDDLLEVEQDTQTLGKNSASDASRGKSTYPSALGADGARARADELYSNALAALDRVPGNSDGLKWVADFILKRVY
jgi:geranylgeranyl pyrophosphate synthase